MIRLSIIESKLRAEKLIESGDPQGLPDKIRDVSITQRAFKRLLQIKVPRDSSVSQQPATTMDANSHIEHRPCSPSFSHWIAFKVKESDYPIATPQYQLEDICLVQAYFECLDCRHHQDATNCDSARLEFSIPRVFCSEVPLNLMLKNKSNSNSKDAASRPLWTMSQQTKDMLVNLEVISKQLSSVKKLPKYHHCAWIRATKEESRSGDYGVVKLPKPTPSTPRTVGFVFRKPTPDDELATRLHTYLNTVSSFDQMQVPDLVQIPKKKKIDTATSFRKRNKQRSGCNKVGRFRKVPRQKFCTLLPLV